MFKKTLSFITTISLSCFNLNAGKHDFPSESVSPEDGFNAIERNTLTNAVQLHEKLEALNKDVNQEITKFIPGFQGDLNIDVKFWSDLPKMRTGHGLVNPLFQDDSYHAKREEWRKLAQQLKEGSTDEGKALGSFFASATKMFSDMKLFEEAFHNCHGIYIPKDQDTLENQRIIEYWGIPDLDKESKPLLQLYKKAPFKTFFPKVQTVSNYIIEAEGLYTMVTNALGDVCMKCADTPVPNVSLIQEQIKYTQFYLAAKNIMSESAVIFPKVTFLYYQDLSNQLENIWTLYSNGKGSMDQNALQVVSLLAKVVAPAQSLKQFIK